MIALGMVTGHIHRTAIIVIKKLRGALPGPSREYVVIAAADRRREA
jgi:hypothetical protein